MRILQIDKNPLVELSYFNAGRRPNDFYMDNLPVYRAEVEGLPDSIDAIVATADLQGLAKEPSDPGMGLPLLGTTVPSLIETMLYDMDISWNKTLALLAGDFYTYPDLHGRGGTGDITKVWDSFSSTFKWVAGVAGNHDMFGDEESYLPKMPGNSVHLLDANRIELEGLSIAGISGVIGNPRKNFRRDHQDFVETLDLILDEPTDIAIMHTGPDAPEIKGCKGIPEVREVIEKQKPSLVVRGHAHWPTPLVELKCGTQILNVDATVVLLVKP